MKYKSIMYLTKKKGDIFMENKKDVILLTGAGQVILKNEIQKLLRNILGILLKPIYLKLKV